jgi:hypothetical protein
MLRLVVLCVGLIATHLEGPPETSKQPSRRDRPEGKPDHGNQHRQVVEALHILLPLSLP